MIESRLDAIKASEKYNTRREAMEREEYLKSGRGRIFLNQSQLRTSKLRSSSTVEQRPVKALVVGSNPTCGAWM